MRRLSEIQEVYRNLSRELNMRNKNEVESYEYKMGYKNALEWILLKDDEI